LAETRKESNTMNEIEKLRGEAREVIAGYCAGGDFDAAVARLAAMRALFFRRDKCLLFSREFAIFYII
jgi:hypothetical protein